MSEARFTDEDVRRAVADALHQAADTMPIETLLGADKASQWLRDRADTYGERQDT